MDVAKMAKVSKSTASKALNNSREISDKTRARILEIARNIGYVPDETAQILAGKKTKTIGLVINEIDANYYNDVVGVIERKLKEQEYSLLISLTGFNVENQIYYIKLLMQKRVDGMIISHNGNAMLEEELRKIPNICETPIVLLGNPISGLDLDIIENDHEFAMDLAINHLLNLGHKKICFIGDEISQARKSLYVKTLKKCHLKLDKSLIKEGKERFEFGGYLRMKELLEDNKKGFAVIAHYDSMANGAIRAIMEKGLKIPDDISIIGFDNIQESEYYQVPLTTVEFPNSEIGSLAVKMLIDGIEKGTDTFKKHIILKPRLVLRKSTGPCQNRKGYERSEFS
jgi:Transcriptional regulators